MSSNADGGKRALEHAAKVLGAQGAHYSACRRARGSGAQRSISF